MRPIDPRSDSPINPLPDGSLYKLGLRRPVCHIPQPHLHSLEPCHDRDRGDVSDGNRSIPVHLINLYDEEGSLIRPGDEPILPFSTKQTCLPCHNYAKISSGWHFNAADPNAHPGRRGQPWILADRTTATQLPLSYRNWTGAYQPDDLGITPLQFIQRFGRHMPGGSIGDDEERQAPENVMRWWVSGKLEVNKAGRKLQFKPGEFRI